MTKYAVQNGEHTSGERLGTVPYEEMATLAKDNPHQAFIVSVLGRPGFAEFTQELEYRRYTPNTLQNIKFELLFIKWTSEILCAAAVFPLEDLPFAKELAAKFGIEFKGDTELVLIGKDAQPPFPIESAPNLFVASGVDEKLARLPGHERRKLFLERELELKKAYGVSEENDPPAA